MAPDSEARWISIIYTSAGKFKVLHLVALTSEVYYLWMETLQTLHEQRKELMGGLDQMRKRQSVWLKQHWSIADLTGDQKLDLKDVATLCRNLNISATEKDLQANFAVRVTRVERRLLNQLRGEADYSFTSGRQRADKQNHGYLDFSEFQMFVKYLRSRKEVESIMQSISSSKGYLSLQDYVCFMRKTQQVGFFN